MCINVGINGFGRIGRIVFRTSFEYKFNLVAVNDPAFDLDYLKYLITFDSTHGKFNGDVRISPDSYGLIVNGKFVHVFHEKNISSVPWQLAGVDYVVEATGVFNTMEKASGHLGRGVKRVIVAAPSVDIPMFILGVNDADLLPTYKLVSCASSTVYCLAVLLHALDRRFGVAEGLVTVLQAATAALKPADGLCVRGKNWREHRGLLQNVIPTASGVCRALYAVLPRLRERLAALALRAPVLNVSMVDLSVRLSSDTSLAQILEAVERAGRGGMRDVIRVSRERAVSADFLGDRCSCILDAESSLQLNSRSYKLICWYENEYSFARRVLSTVELCARQLSAVTVGDSSQSAYGLCGDMKVPVIVNEVTMKGRPPKSPIVIQNLNAFSSNYAELQSLQSRMDLIKLWNSEAPARETDGRIALSGDRWSSDLRLHGSRNRQRLRLEPRTRSKICKSFSQKETDAAKGYKLSSTVLRFMPKRGTTIPSERDEINSTKTCKKLASHTDLNQLKAMHAVKNMITERAPSSEAVAASPRPEIRSTSASEELIANVKPFLVAASDSSTSSCRGALLLHCRCSLCRAPRRPPEAVYDKLSCTSASDAGPRSLTGGKSQVIDIVELALSIDDFGHLDQLCKVFEKSDDVDAALLSTLGRSKSANAEAVAEDASEKNSELVRARSSSEMSETKPRRW